MRRLLSLLILTSCADPQLTGSDTRLAVEPAELVFEHVWVGHPEVLPLALLNEGRATQDLEVTVEGPFALDQIPTELTGAARQERQVRFVPSEAGTFEGSIRIGHEGGEVIVPLRGTAEQPAACGDSECHSGLFDPELGVCRQVQLEDGTACESVCLEEPTCQQGRCVGKPRSCDDEDVCTADACDPAKGCVHVDTTAQCPKPSNPCRVAVCEPKNGCDEEDAADYTPCGAVSCAAANVCFAGACMAFDPPEGFPCAPATPCQSGGTCRNKQCETPSPGKLPISWTWTPPGLHFVARLDLADADGNLYVQMWPYANAHTCATLYLGSPADISRCIADYDSRQHSIVSLTPEGAVRWTQSGTGPFLPLFVDHGRIWVNSENKEVRVLNAADGTLVTTIPSTFERLLAGDRIVIATRWMPSSGDTVLTAFDALDGSQLWMKRFTADGDAILRAPVLLDGDRIMLMTYRGQQKDVELLVLDAAGNELSRKVGPDISLAISPMRGFPVFYEVSSKLTGFDAQSSSFKWQVDPLMGSVGAVTGYMVGGDRVYLQITQQPGSGQPYEHRLVSLRLTDGGRDWSVLLETTSAINEFWLTDRNSIVVEHFGGLDKFLAERRAHDGSLVYSCALERSDDVVVIGHGRAFATSSAGVTAYLVPNLGLSKTGWNARDGNPGRSLRPW